MQVLSSRKKERFFEMKKRVCIYEMKNGSEQVSQEDYSNPHAEASERSAMEKEIRDPKSYVKGFRFEWREIPSNQ